MRLLGGWQGRTKLAGQLVVVVDVNPLAATSFALVGGRPVAARAVGVYPAQAVLGRVIQRLSKPSPLTVSQPAQLVRTRRVIPDKPCPRSSEHASNHRADQSRVEQNSDTP
jgi:hypothetical protein